ncbi:MAG TPA: hypothetical protein VIL74_08305 [Pyrinomonadaceae bacterium]
MEKIEGSLSDLQNPSVTSGSQTLLAALEMETNTIHIFNDKIVDVTSLVQKFRYYCNLPNNHRFSVLYK